MKKKIAGAAALSAASVLCAFVVLAMLLRPVAVRVDPVDVGRVADGEYIGVSQNKILFAVVRVTVKDRRITDIGVLYHKDAYRPQAERIAAEVVSSQSLDVDTISGATLTCGTVLQAVQNALLAGVQGEEEGIP